MFNSLQPHRLWSPPISGHGILQARILEWVAILFSRGASQPKDWTLVSCIADTLYSLSHQGSPKGGHSRTVINMHYRATGFPSGSVVKKKKKKICLPMQEWNKKGFSLVQLFATPWTIQSMEFSRPEYWSG